MRQFANFKLNSANIMPSTSQSRPAPLGDMDPFRPNPMHAVRLRARSMAADTHFEPHRHDWAQLAYCASGTVQVRVLEEANSARQGSEVGYIVPPSRAVWIAPGALHAIRVLEAAELRTLYIDASAMPDGWQVCRALLVSPLLRELVVALDGLQGRGTPSSEAASAREQALIRLVLDEITQADRQSLGVPLPHAETGDKRLRALCLAVLANPGRRATLAQWALEVGASERTMARLFRDQLGMGYTPWRQQAVLAHALALLAQAVPVAQVAAATGYASDSAFSAMFKAAMGQPPRAFQEKSG